MPSLLILEKGRISLILTSNTRLNCALLAATFLLSMGAATASASILERVIALLDAVYPELKASNISANIAENFSNPTTRVRSLKVGDSVIIGYDTEGMAVLGTADAVGVWVDPLQSAALGSGVSAGLYPVGSAIYALPPAGQLSIFEQSSDGASLGLAQEIVMTRIDGSINNVITSVPPILTTDLTAFDSRMRASYVDVSTIASTALGAVNTGEIVTHIKVLTGSNALGAPVMDLAQLAKGPNATFEAANAGNVSAIAHRITQMGGGLEESMLALNVASNSSEITGRVSNIIVGLNASIGSIVTTTIGAVNGGSISN